MQLTVHEDAAVAGHEAARYGAGLLRAALDRGGEVTIVVATGASQFGVLEELVATDLDWSRVRAFHLDEYVGLPAEHPASFRRYLRERFVEPLAGRLLAFEEVDGEADPAIECERLAACIRGHRIAVAFIGIGENGHLAFNDPPADFDTTEPYITVELDEACRRQQVGEGWFGSMDEVPTRAISMGIRQILSADHLICTVPDARKAQAVQAAVEGPVTPTVPASILQEHESVRLFLDEESAALLEGRT